MASDTLAQYFCSSGICASGAAEQWIDRVSILLVFAMTASVRRSASDEESPSNNVLLENATSTAALKSASFGAEISVH